MSQSLDTSHRRAECLNTVAHSLSSCGVLALCIAIYYASCQCHSMTGEKMRVIQTDWPDSK